jgi:hypothetical protein
MPDIVCPECGQISTLPAIRRNSDEFCTHCDFPLFWAPSAVPLATQTMGSDTTLRRLPGAGGRQLIGTRVCPTCGELNPVDEHQHLCLRCNNELDPQPVFEPEPEPEIPPPPPPAPVVVQKRNWWPWIILAAVVVITIVVIIVVA